MVNRPLRPNADDRMELVKRLWAFCGLAGLMLGSAAPPPLRSFEVAQRVEAQPRLVVSPDALREPAPAPAKPLEAEKAAVPKPKPAPSVEAAKKPPAAAEPSSRASDVKVVVSLPQQKAYVFKGGKLWATSRVSTGKRGHETPAGTFRILQKKVRHRSNRYANAPMPYMQRLTWSGVALHAGHVPGYRASHGCIRLPWSFARKLYGVTNFATEVTVTHARPKSAAAALRIG